MGLASFNRSRRKTAEANELKDEKKPFDIERLSKDELKTNLTARGIEFKANASVKALQALLTDAMEKEAEQNGSDNP